MIFICVLCVAVIYSILTILFLLLVFSFLVSLLLKLLLALLISLMQIAAGILDSLSLVLCRIDYRVIDCIYVGSI